MRSTMLCLSGFVLYFRWVPLRDQLIYMALDSLWCQDLAFKCVVYKFTPTDAQNTMGTKLMLVHRKLMIEGSTDHLY